MPDRISKAAMRKLNGQNLIERGTVRLNKLNSDPFGASVEIKVDAAHDPDIFRRTFAATVGADPLPDQIRRTVVDTDTTPQQFLQGHSSVPRFVTQKKLPEWREMVAKFLVTGNDADAVAALGSMRGRKIDVRREKETVIDELKRLNLTLDIRQRFHDWVEWATSHETFRLEAPQKSSWHKVREAFEAGHIIHGKENEEGAIERAGAEFDPFFATEPQVFLVEHDWSAAFAKATDFDEGEFPMPFANCAFEFMVSGRRVLCLAADSRLAVVSDVGEGFWCCSAWTTLEDLDTSVRYKVIAKNVRALCIALDAEIVVSQVVRAPHRLNISREKRGMLPINDYHVINLAKRSRVEALPSAGEREAKWHPRLHFRRGHWRHYENHKTWIKWMLVGDPDLGFIDKEYRA